MLTFDKQCLLTKVSTLLIRKHSLRLLALSSLAKNHQTNFNARHPLWQSHRSDYQWTKVQSKAWILNLCEWNYVNEIMRMKSMHLTAPGRQLSSHQGNRGKSALLTDEIYEWDSLRVVTRCDSQQVNVSSNCKQFFELLKVDANCESPTP